MLAAQLVLFVVTSCHALSIGTVSEKTNVTKREAGEFYPDWVPFKNKNGEEELSQVVKAKPKKRLALPVNFVLRAVVEPEGDDYYDKGQGGTNGDEYFEKKEWSDLNRQPQERETKAPINHTDISDIDGVVDIITNIKPVETINVPSVQSSEEISDSKEKESKEEDKGKVKLEEAKNEPKAEESKTEEKKQEEKKQEEETDYEEESAEKAKEASAERSESEAKKASILESVDELKVRHEEEQRAISEKAKEEEIQKEEHERNKILPEDQIDKYGDSIGKQESTHDFDEYNRESPLDDKYKINSPKRKTTRHPKKAKRKGKKNKNAESGKLSVFKNPSLYMVYDDADQTKPEHSTEKFSHFSATPGQNAEESVRISLVPENKDAKEGEPTLFFPKKRKGKLRRKSTTPAPDSYVAESIEEKTAKDLLTASNTATSTKDAVPASSDHKEEAPKVENYQRERGGGREYQSDHMQEHGEHGKKAYEVTGKSSELKPEIEMVNFRKWMQNGPQAKPKPWYYNYNMDGVHEDEKTAKGHHDKEDHHGHYDDNGGFDANHHVEKAHYGAHHQEEHGKKHAKYEESGKHSKGHSTRGSHDIHKKEEYEKNVEFFEEEGDSGEEEKHGGYNDEREHSSGGHFKKGNFAAGHHERHKGESGSVGKGGHVHGHKGHSSSAGHDTHGKHGHDQYHHDSKDAGKKWIYHHGHPAKTSHLALIDRRADKYSHGPQYYG